MLAAPGLESKLCAFEPLPARGSITEDLRVQLVAGAPSMNEHAFLHVLSRSLVVSDRVFNIHSGANIAMSIVLWRNGALGKVGQSRVWRFVSKDRGLAGRSTATILDWKFERVVVAHGDVIETDACARISWSEPS